MPRRNGGAGQVHKLEDRWAGWDALKRADRMRLFLQFDNAGAVVDADGAELAEHLAEQAIELGAKGMADGVQVHDRDPLSDPSVVGRV